MVRRRNWPFLRVAVSLKPESHRPPKLVCMLVTSIFTCLNFLSRFQSIKFFDEPWTIVHGQKGKFGHFEGSSIFETGRVMPTKIGVHACYTNPYLHEFFESILMD